MAQAQSDFETQLAATATADCAMACRALESLRRAADRICELDPGAPCSDARDKAARAAARVRGACPECAAATQEEKTAQPVPANRTTTAEGPVMEQEAAAPPQRGCASCTLGAPVSGGAAAALAALVALAAACVRRRRAR
jgi:hypothetical protein